MLSDPENEGEGLNLRQMAERLTREIGGKDTLLEELRKDNPKGWVEGMIGLINANEETALSVSQLVLFYHMWSQAGYAEEVDVFDSSKPQWWSEAREILYSRQELRLKEEKEGRVNYEPTGKKFPLTNYLGLRRRFLSKGKFGVFSEGIQKQVLGEIGLDPDKEYVVIIPGKSESR